MSTEGIAESDHSEKNLHREIITLRNEGKLKQAHELSIRAQRIYPDSLQIAIAGAEVTMRSRKWGDSIARWVHIRDNFLRAPVGVHLRLAEAYYEAGEYPLATKVIDHLSKSSPAYPGLDEFRDKLARLRSQKWSVFAVDDTDMNAVSFQSLNRLYSFDELLNFDLASCVKSTNLSDKKLAYISRSGVVHEIDSRVIANFPLGTEKSKSRRARNRLPTVNLFSLLGIGLLKGESFEQLISIRISSHTKVLQGSSGWLFLDNDTNRSVDQYSGRYLLPQDDLVKWDHFFRDLLALGNVEASAFIVAPAKESVRSEFYPYQKANKRIVDQVMSRHGFALTKGIYPISSLAREASSYYRTDTHWSDVGAFIAYCECMKVLGLHPIDRSKLDLRKESYIGDLGNKLFPQAYDYRACVEIRERTYITAFDNNIHNTGSFVIFENDKPEIDGTVVVFGDSFSTNLMPYFAQSFRRAVRMYTAGSVVMELLNTESSVYVISQITERFLTNPPRVVEAIRHTGLPTKLNALTREEMNYLTRKMQAYPEADNPVKRFMESYMARKI